MKKFTNFKPSSSPGKRAMFRLVGTKIKFIILLTVLLTGLRIDLYSNCIGCGGQIGGNQPCYTIGQIISNVSWFQSPNEYIHQTVTYIGGCQVEYVNRLNGYFWNSSIYDGGCNCGWVMPFYDQHVYPLSKWESDYTDPAVLNVNTEITLSKIEVRQLKENGEVVFSKLDSTSANQTVSIPMSLFQNGQKYIVIGYDLWNNSSTYLPIRKTATNIEELKLFCSWGTPDSVDTQRQCVAYIGDDSTMVLIQHLDKSVEIFPGTTDVSVGINPKESTDANATELSQNYPNPFNSSTAIELTIRNSANVNLAIYDIQGKEIERLIDGYLVPGKYQFIWKATGYENGTYYYRLVSDYAVETKKMILLK